MADEKDEAQDTRPPVVDAATGVHMAGADGKYPLNHRLRAEAMAADGVTTDPDGLIGDDVIADAAKRLKAEPKAEAVETPSLKWTRDKLVAHVEELRAAGRTIGPIETDADKPTILALINAATAA